MKNPKRLNRIFILIPAILFCLVVQGAGTQPISLAGAWRFALDRKDTGLKEQWFNRELADKINLPGALQSQGYGDEISTHTPWVLSLYDKNWFLRADYTNYTKPGAVKVPFLCQPPRHYLGAAWYQRDIEIPQDWQDRRVVLFLERPHCESRVWLDDLLIGTNNSLCVPHEFELGVSLKPGKHRLTVRVDNRVVYRGPDQHAVDAHSVSDSLGQSWNGIVGKMELRSTSLVWIEDVKIYPRASTVSVTIKGTIGNRSGKSGNGQLHLQVKPTALIPEKLHTVDSLDVGVAWTTNGGVFETEMDLKLEAELWDEFNPVVYRLAVWMDDGAVVGTFFGLREFDTDETDLRINGRKTFLRGTHHGGDFPLTGYPPTDVEYWRKIFQVNKDWGMNHIRFHSYCPPEAAFEAADELGLYLQIEPGTWNTFSPGSAMDEWLYAETERILKAYGNHPSFVMFSPSNEPKGRWKESLTKWAEHFRAEDSRWLYPCRRFYTSGTGFTDPDAPGPLDKVDYTATQRFGGARVRGEGAWFGRDYSLSLQGVNVPVVTHEVGQWIAYPDYDIIKKFTGYLQPGNYEIFRDSAEAHGLFGSAGSPLPADGAHGVTRPTNKDFAWASGRFQLACYKEEIEANLRTPGLAGFQLLDLHDYVGQGTALVGLLDTFWESKGYATAKDFKKFCNTVVPLARLTKRTFTTSDKFDVPVEVAHFGATAMTNAIATWQILDAQSKAVAEGKFRVTNIPIGKSISLGSVAAELSRLAAPAAYRLVINVHESSGIYLGKEFRINGAPEFSNDWNFWLYPAKVSDAPS